ncbi:VUT family protein [Breoghania sp.]|uniref:VUT family protein n=1 Tax=Breoghania sp. TaxID=2065378 RepID=UPI002AABA1AB|nr:VUT family protein [Breoghania sp.]
MTRTQPLTVRSLALGVTAMALVVLASNILVQYPFQMTVGGYDLADLLTWGAFTYPAAFLVTDLTNRRFGAVAARWVVFVGFCVAVALSVTLSNPRIALASGSAFLAAQMLDVFVFDRLRRSSWWKAPFLSSFLGSVLDTILFFGIAFSMAFAFLGHGDAFATDQAPLLGLFNIEAPRWISWAVGDFSVKMLVSLTLLAPYRLLMQVIRPMPAVV